MLQDLHANSVHSDAVTDEDAAAVSRSPESQQFSANTYAERLMDDLFEEVEQLLNLDAAAVVEAPCSIEPAPADLSAQSVSASESVATNAAGSTLEPGMPLATRSAAIALQSTPAIVSPGLTTVTPSHLTPQTAPAAPATAPAAQRERFWLASGCISIVVALGLWLLYQEGKQRQQAVNRPDAAATSYSPADQKFAEYVQRSLQQIDQQAQQSGETTASANTGVKVPGMPTVVIPPATTPTPTAVAPPSNRVYVPIYQLPTNLYPPGAPVAPLPNLPPSAKPAPAASAPKATNSDAPGVMRRLVGVLEQGNSSVALFEINGVTQRYELGESIGSSGWTLVEVSKNQAIIRRNGDVRSLFVGHSF